MTETPRSVQYSGESRPKRHPDAASRIYDGEAFIVLPQQSVYKILNSTGTRIWDLIDGNRSIDDMVRVIADEYDVTVEEARNDILEFIRDLTANGMLAGDTADKVA